MQSPRPLVKFTSNIGDKMANMNWSEDEHALAAELLAVMGGNFQAVIATHRLEGRDVGGLRRQW